jgi:hypothetical protein
MILMLIIVKEINLSQHPSSKKKVKYRWSISLIFITACLMVYDVRNALMLMLWKRQCVPKHTSTLEYHVSDASLLIYKLKYMCNPKLLFNDI